jgi:hypothetical protein
MLNEKILNGCLWLYLDNRHALLFFYLMYFKKHKIFAVDLQNSPTLEM